MMNQTTRQFFSLLSSGVWGTNADTTLFAGKVEWACIMQLAEKQTVLGVVFDGLETLPKNLRPPMELLMEWFGQTSYIEHKNSIMELRR